MRHYVGVNADLKTIKKTTNFPCRELFFEKLPPDRALKLDQVSFDSVVCQSFARQRSMITPSLSKSLDDEEDHDEADYEDVDD